MKGLLQDVRQAARAFAGRPGLSLAAAATLALGIGASTAIFSAVDAVLIHPLPYADQDRLVVMWQTDPVKGTPLIEVSYPEFESWRDRAESFSGLAAMTATNFRVNLTGRGEPMQVEAAAVSAVFFDVLGIRPAPGRSFRADEDREGAAPVAIISHGLWQRHYGSDPGIVGSSITADGTAVTVVGVAPPDVSLPKGADLWLPAGPVIGTGEARRYRVLEVVGRLAPGTSLEGARAEMDVLAKQPAATPAEGTLGIRVISLPQLLYGDTRPALLLLAAAVGFLLLIACANVANLLLVRAADREREMALRAVLGASWWRLVRQLLSESGLLALVGGAAGVALAAWGVRAIGANIPAGVPGVRHVTLDGRVLLFALLVTVATAVLFGLVPALRTARADPGDGLREAPGRASEGRRGRRIRSALVVAEIALCLVLLTGAGLTARSFAGLLRLEPGFDPHNVLTARISLPEKYTSLQDRTTFFAPLLERMKAIPGVESASMVLLRPLVDPIGWDYEFTVEGQSRDDQLRNPPCNYEAASEDYFRTMRIPLTRGRVFTEDDGPDGARVAIISQGLADRHWSEGDALGKRIKFDRAESDAPWHTVVGIVGDVRYRGWTSVWVDAYVPYRQWSFGRMDLMLRTTTSAPSTVVPALRAAVYAGDPDLPIAGVTTMEQAVADAVAGPRLTASLLGLFAGAAALLAAVGIHGVMAASVARRTREIGVRMALGAARRTVLWLVMREVATMAAFGIGIGLPCAWALSRLVESQLFGLPAADPATALTAIAILLGVTAAAGYIPACRATLVEPMKALRHE